MKSEVPETCLFFIDDSNTWIEAQKFAALGNSHMPKLTDSDRDPRLRINVGKLVDTIRKDRSQGLSFYYGSRPPRNDSVWKALEKFKFQTKIYDRSHGKEKEVDNSMATDMSAKATELSIRAEYDEQAKLIKANTTFVCITGDRDMLPPVRKVLESNIKVELWAWESGISTEYLKLNGQDGLLSVNYINWIFEQVSFTNFSSTRHTTGRGASNQVDPGQTIVLCEFAPTWFGDDGELRDDRETRDRLEAAVCEKLLSRGRLFYITWAKTGSAVFVQFPKVTNIEAMVLMMRGEFKAKARVLSWPEYAGLFNQGSVPTMVETSNMYALLEGDDNNGPGLALAAVPQVPKLAADHEATKSFRAATGTTSRTTEPVSRGNEEAMTQPLDPDNSGGWQTVVRSDLKKDHQRGLRQAQPCPDRVRCKKRGECGYRHSNEERNLFRDFPNQDFRLWKTKKCGSTYCRRGRRCPFAHTQSEAWCLRCHHEGHYTDECRYRS